MKTKEFHAQVKAVGEDGLKDGEFRALVSVFDNVDHYGEVVMPGAFKDTLAEWESKGDPIPVIWAHQWADPFSHIGTVTKAVETDRGLEILGYISPEERAENPTAAQVYRLLKTRRITQFSFGFDVESGGVGERGEASAAPDGEESEGTKSRQVYELRKLKLHEVGPCLLGVNPDTELLAVKARDLEARTLAGNPKALESVREAYAALELVLDEITRGETQTPGGEDPAGTEDNTEIVSGNESEPRVVPDPSASGDADPASQFTSYTQRLDLDLLLAQAETD